MKLRGQIATAQMLLSVVILVLVLVATVSTVGTETSKVTNTTAGFIGANVTGASNALTLLMPVVYIAVGIILLSKFLS